MPNKTISLEESSLYKACQLLEVLESPIELVELYQKNKKIFPDMSSYIDALDMLYVLGKIDVKEGVVHFA
ncbi:ABC-three component system middle component 7 [Rheinheimera baltica]|uniref:ABC-three component system middle component 7 n=1 Tax=Rheinheimera baltica TaxID=67576 RepID=UPI00273E73A4|nr:ABC-three component system middle component 7 [Rheinheimera baltica]